MLSAKGTYDGGGFDKGVSSNEKSLERFRAKCSAVSVAVGNVLAGMASKGFGAITSHIDAAVSRVDKLNQFPKVMQNLGYSADDASASVSKMSSGIEGLPTSLDEIVGNTQALALSLGDLGKATDVAVALNDGFLTFGASSSDVTNAITQLNQMITAGAYDQQSWNSINQSAPGFLDTMASSMLGAGKKAGDLRAALNKGKVSSQDFLDAIVDLDQNGAEGVTAFSKSAQDSVGGIGTSMKNVGTAITKNLANIVDAVNGSGAISGFFDSMKSAVNSAGKAVLPAAAALGQFVAAVQQGQPILQSLGSALDMSGQLDSLQRFASECASAFNAAETPLDGFKAVLGNVKGALSSFAGSGALSGFADAVREKFGQLPQPIRDAMTAIGGFLDSSAGKAAAFAAVLAGALSAFGAPLTAAVAGVAGLAAKLGGLSGIVGGVAGAISAIGSKVNLLGSAVTLCGGGVSGLARVVGGGLSSALGAVASPVGIAVAAIAALAAGFAYMMATNEDFRSSVVALVGSIGASLAPVLASVGAAVASLASNVLPMVAGIVSEIAPALGQIVQVALELAAALAPIVSMLVSSLMPAVTSVVTVVVSIVQAAMPSIVGAINLVLGAVQAAIPVVSAIATVVASVVSAVVNTVAAVATAVGAAAATVVGVISTVVSTVANMGTVVTTLASGLAAVVGGAVAAVAATVSTGLNSVLQTFQAICAAVSSVVSGLVSAVASFFEAIASCILSAVAGAQAAVSSAFDAIVTAVTGALDMVVAVVSALPGDIVGGLGDLSELLVSQGRDVIQGFVNGIKGMVDSAISAVKGVADSIVGAISGALKIGSPSKVMKEIGGYTVEGLAIGIERNGDAQEAMESVGDELCSSGWTYGYHAAVNYAQGLSKGSSKAKSAASGLGSSAESGLSDADAELNAYIDGMIENYKARANEFKAVSQELGDAIWGPVSQAVGKIARVKPDTGAVYESVKALKNAGYTVESFYEKQLEWEDKLADGMDGWDASTRREYASWQKLSSSVTASLPDMEEWWSLATVKSDIISGQDSAESMGDALKKLRGRGIAYSQDFVEAFAGGSDEYKRALAQMSDMTDEQVKQMVDSYEDMKRAEREQDIEQRSLWVNSLKTLNSQGEDSRDWLLGFRETCLDVKEAVYSDKGLDSAFKMTGTSVEEFASKLSGLDATMDDVKAGISSFASSVSNGFEQMTKNGKTSLDEWTRNVKLNMAESQDYAKNLEAVFSKLSPDIDSEAFRKQVYADGFEKWGQVVADMAGKSSEEIGEVVKLFNDAALEGQQSAIEQFKALSPGDEYANAIAEGIAQGKQAIGSALAESVDEGIQLLAGSETVQESMQAVASMLAESTAQGISDGSRAVQDGIAGVTEAAKGTALGFAGQFADVGAQLAEGIAEGISSRVGAIADAAAATVSAAIAAAKAAADIHSPSKVAKREVGAMLSKGVAAGIFDAGRDAVSAMRSVIGDVAGVGAATVPAGYVSYGAPSPGGAVAGGSNKYVFGDVNVSATVRSDRDVRELAKQINREQTRMMRAGGFA